MKFLEQILNEILLFISFLEPLFVIHFLSLFCANTKKSLISVISASQFIMLMSIFSLKMADNQSNDARPLQFVSFSSSVHPGNTNERGGSKMTSYYIAYGYRTTLYKPLTIKSFMGRHFFGKVNLCPFLC